jgi:hypothetical protein
VLIAAFIAVASVVKPTVVPTVVPTALMHQNDAIATAATVRATMPLWPGSATLFLSSGIEASGNHGDLALAVHDVKDSICQISLGEDCVQFAL